MRALEKKEDGDFEVFGAVDLPGEGVVNIDEATDALFKKLGWPLIGGMSGRGWSYFSTAQRCAQLFYMVNDAPGQHLARKTHPQPLQIGALFHTLQALYYAGGLGESYVMPDRGGLVSEDYKLAGRRRRWRAPLTAADDFLNALKAQIDGEGTSPDGTVVAEAERLFDAHTNWWNNREDVTPLGIEVFAAHPTLGYTCRYDLIGRVGDGDPNLPAGVCIFEKKTAKWIDEKYLEGWQLDGEVLGQLLCWEASGMTELFGPLAAIVIDVVSKGRIPECRRVVLPPTLPAVARHEKWIKWQTALIHQWRAMNVYPQSFANCWTRYGRCDNFENCTLGLMGDHA